MMRFPRAFFSRLFACLLLFAVISGIFYSCAKYISPKPASLNLTGHFCNDPNAVNYNVGFPGIPDSSVCIYPSGLFLGTYVFHDSVSNDSLYLFTDSLLLRIYDSGGSHFVIGVAGLCTNDTSRELFLTASAVKVATVDTQYNDTVTLVAGQTMCSPYNDTVTGTMSIDILDSTLLHISLSVITGTVVNTHTGSARKQ